MTSESSSSRGTHLQTRKNHAMLEEPNRHRRSTAAAAEQKPDAKRRRRKRAIEKRKRRTKTDRDGRRWPNTGQIRDREGRISTKTDRDGRRRMDYGVAIGYRCEPLPTY
ncbi:unnamed protein product [Sphagnum jensenii]|uniref:Uncharacterized protein n=2 Tax=Sphagnum jensenii TaxID=128206 RepID=A0ABP1AKT7_9BRYO